MAKIPNTNLKIRTSHSLAIRVRGKTVGLIQSFGYTLSRGVTPVFELNPDTTGEPVDLVPGNIGTLELSVRRVDLITEKLEEALGGIDISMLSDQNNPFEIMEVWKNPDGSVEQYVYEGCWFSNIGRTMSSTGDRLVIADARIAYIRRRRVA